MGRLQPEDGIVPVALPKGAGDAPIDRLLVAEGNVLAVPDRLATYQSTLTVAARTVAIRRAALAQVRVQVAATEAELRAQKRGAEAMLAAAEREQARVCSLFDRGTTTQAILEDAERSTNTARADRDRLRASPVQYQPGPDGQVDFAVAMADLAAA